MERGLKGVDQMFVLTMRLQLSADAQLGEKPFTSGMRGQRCHKTGLKTQKMPEKAGIFRYENRKKKVL